MSEVEEGLETLCRRVERTTLSLSETALEVGGQGREGRVSP